MLTRAGATNLRMVSVLGVNMKLLNTMLFGLGAALAGLAGLMAAPILATWLDASFAWRQKTLAWPTRGRCAWR